MEIAKLLLCIAAAAFLGELVRQYAPAYGPLYSAGACACVLLCVAGLYAPQLQALCSRLGGADMNTRAGVLLKAVGIAVLAELVQDICEEAGQKALSTKAGFAGRIAVLVAALPLFEDVLNMLTELLL